MKNDAIDIANLLKVGRSFKPLIKLYKVVSYNLTYLLKDINYEY